ncbi:hypothetical protein Pmani_007467 [Petrolisthes manimaculis]|uniref:Uncharacterized protein n=1 Tax=Petrolisthes manimaculis TaxID=1843537 RepID=A0AAE1UIP6_9EUCA|nr:hypothetical protein Pmani_007467 [Petrolisthes manimaculis]
MNRSRRPPSLPDRPPGELLFTAQQTGSKLPATGASTGGVAMIWQWFGWVGVVGGAGDSRGGAAVTRNPSAATIGTCHPEPPTSEEYRAPGRSLTPHAPPHQPAQLLSDNLYEISSPCGGDRWRGSGGDEGLASGVPGLRQQTVTLCWLLAAPLLSLNFFFNT